MCSPFRYLLVLVLICVTGCQKDTSRSFVPDNFIIPDSLVAGQLRLKPLTIEYAQKDYDAVMDSRDELRKQFGGSWPEDGFTLEENQEDIREHEQLHEARQSFTYTVLSKDNNRVLGCVYINAVDSSGFDAQVHMWVRRGESILPLKAAVQDWLDQDWPFEQVLYHDT